MLVRVRQQVGRPHEQEEPGVDREQCAERLLADRQRGADDRAGERRRRVDREPPDRPPAVARLAEHEGDGVQAVREVVADDRDEDEDAGRRVEAEGEPDAEPVDEAVQREAGGAERSDLRVRPRLLGLVAVVQDERALGEEEEEEAAADEEADALRIVDRLDRLGEDVKERDRDDDAAGQRDRGREVAREPERDEPARERRQHGRRRPAEWRPRPWGHSHARHRSGRHCSDEGGTLRRREGSSPRSPRARGRCRVGRRGGRHDREGSGRDRQRVRRSR